MDATERSRLMVTAGVLVAAAVVLAAYLGGYRVKPSAEPAAAMPVAAAPAVVRPGGPVAAPMPVAVAPPAPTCPSEALAEPGARGDGLFALQPALGGTVTDPAAFLAVAREAQQQGHVRDAEVALMAACHVAEKSAGAQSAPLADIKSQLGQHYASLAAREGDGVSREALLQRASALYSESAAVYAGALGKNASKTQMAERRLAALREPGSAVTHPRTVVVAAPSMQPPAPLPIAPDTARMGSARSSLASRPPMHDENLGQVDADLDRLYAQARRVSRDPAGMQRRQQQALAQRSACRGDEGCLRAWYAHRRSQLFAEF
ncbi:MAG TPA: hypothetical protein VF522_08760 [Ramlibacter sp.]|uniref:hypothetical protein n=1 Tax=Ramlibacter sp. TaxID=1917967 RepID=UPI002ED37151